MSTVAEHTLLVCEQRSAINQRFSTELVEMSTAPGDYNKLLNIYTMNMLKKLKKELHVLADPHKACILQRFFKTGKGEYGEGDRFLGITVPKQRQLIKNYVELELENVSLLLSSSWHEERLSAVLLLVHKYQKTKDSSVRQKLYDFYLGHAASINNWDLVDLSAPQIVGNYLFLQDKTVLHTLVQDKNLWLRRIAIVATLYFIRNDYYKETIILAQTLLNDKEDLIHKACGWMLREIGKRDINTLQSFLDDNYKKMPRTMLRYAIERLPEQERKFYLRKDK